MFAYLAGRSYDSLCTRHKNCGNLVRRALKREFNQRFLHDDEDWAGYKSPEADARRVANAARMRDRRDELLEKYDVIHGVPVANLIWLAVDRESGNPVVG